MTDTIQFALEYGEGETGWVPLPQALFRIVDWLADDLPVGNALKNAHWCVTHVDKDKDIAAQKHWYKVKAERSPWGHGDSVYFAPRPKIKGLKIKTMDGEQFVLPDAQTALEAGWETVSGPAWDLSKAWGKPMLGGVHPVSGLSMATHVMMSDMMSDIAQQNYVPPPMGLQTKSMVESHDQQLIALNGQYEALQARMIVVEENLVKSVMSIDQLEQRLSQQFDYTIKLEQMVDDLRRVLIEHGSAEMATALDDVAEIEEAHLSDVAKEVEDEFYGPFSDPIEQKVIALNNTGPNASNMMVGDHVTIGSTTYKVIDVVGDVINVAEVKDSKYETDGWKFTSWESSKPAGISKATEEKYDAFVKEMKSFHQQMDKLPDKPKPKWVEMNKAPKSAKKGAKP